MAKTTTSVSKGEKYTKKELEYRGIVKHVPEGKSGNVVVERFTVTEEAEKGERLRAVFSGSGRAARAGTYTRLMVAGEVMMSDTWDEQMDHVGFARRASGRVLVGGLGLGMVVCMLLDPENGGRVTHVTVVEKNPDVLKLVGPTYAKDPRVRVVEGDVYAWTPPAGETFDHAWMDVWPTLCEDNLKEMATLRRRYKKWMTDQDVDRVGCWGREWLQARRARERRGGFGW